MLIISIVAALIAFMALLISWGSYRIAQKSLSISKRQEDQRKPQLSFYISENFYKIINQDKFFFFTLKITNPSDVDNAITGCDLKITYTRTDKSLGNIVLQHDCKLLKEIRESDFPQFLLPMQVKAHGAQITIAIFKLDKKLDRALRFEKYEVYFREAHGLESMLDVSLMKDSDNA